MTANLHDVLARVGPLDDRIDPGTPRGRLHRFIDQHGADARSIGGFLAQCQERLGRQHAYARQDLIVKLGESLGFETHYGTYDSARGRLPLAGQWRSPGGTLLLLDVRSERTHRDDAEDLTRAIDMTASHRAFGSVRVEGLIVITPFYVSRRFLEQWLVQRQRRDVRCVTLDSLVWLARMRAAARLSFEEIERLLTSGVDADFTIALARRLTAAATPLPDAFPAARSVERRTPRQTTRADGPCAWIAMLFHSDTATPRQLLDSAIRPRQTLDVNRIRRSAPGRGTDGPRTGERVFFYLAGEGLAGEARIDAVLAGEPAPTPGAGRRVTGCRLRNVEVYDVARFVDPGCAAGQVIYGALADGAGVVLHPLAETDAAALRGSGPASPRPFVS